MNVLVLVLHLVNFVHAKPLKTSRPQPIEAAFPIEQRAPGLANEREEDPPNDRGDFEHVHQEVEGLEGSRADRRKKKRSAQKNTP